MKLYRQALLIFILIVALGNAALLLYCDIIAIQNGGLMVKDFNSINEAIPELFLFSFEILAIIIFVIGGIGDRNRSVIIGKDLDEDRSV